MKNTFDVRKPSGEEIFKATKKYGIDPITSEHIPELGEIRRKGFLFGPPNCKKQDFKYWHVNYDSVLSMKFLKEERLQELLVYHYVTKFTADQTNSLDHLNGVPEARGVDLEVELHLWIEPISGKMIKYEDAAIAYFYDIKTKKRLFPWNKFHNSFEEITVSRKIAEAKQHLQKELWLKKTIPLSFVLLALIVLLIGYKFLEKLLWRLYLTVSLIALCGTGLTFMIYSSMKSNNRTLQYNEFENECENFHFAITKEITKSVNALYPVKSLFDIYPNLKNDEFVRFVKDFQNLQNLKFPISYAPLIAHSDKVQFESTSLDHRNLPVKLFEMNASNKKVSVEKRNYYAPIYYIEPQLGNISPIGFDLLSNETRKKTLQRASKTFEIATTELIYLVQYSEKKPGLLLVLAIQDNSKSPRIIKGFITSPISIDKLFHNAFISKQLNSDIFLEVHDNFGNLIYSTNKISNLDRQLNQKSTVQVADRAWSLSFHGSKSFGSVQNKSFENFVLIIGILFTALISTFLFFVLSDDRKKVMETNKRLAAELDERERAEKKLIDVEQFAYIASHDLQQPLRTVSNYIGLINDFIPDDTKKEIEPFIKTISGATSRMQELIKDLLEYSRLGKEDNKTEVNCNELLNNIITDLESMIQGQNALITFDKLPIINGYKSGLNSVFQNLINNAIKFNTSDKVSTVHIQCRVLADEYLFEVIDNGIGIESRYLDKIFAIFQRLHSEKEFSGTGIGLAQCKKIVELHGGRIGVSSIPMVGSTFYFTIPK
ncbi:MAG: CHASE domain-containing protein [Bacteroidetes bacterium]|nr:CHASE domain-containing protein [Bacteroidota bacterium]